MCALFSNQNLLSFKKDLEAHKQMILFVGAGINCSPGVHLLWDDILNYLMDRVIHQMGMKHNADAKTVWSVNAIFKGRPSGFKTVEELESWFHIYKSSHSAISSTSKAFIIKSVLGDKYIPTLQYYIYKECNQFLLKEEFEKHYTLSNLKKQSTTERLPFYTLYQLARMVILCPQIKAIVTYNYDNFLTRAISILWRDRSHYFTQEELASIERCRSELHISDIFGNSYDDSKTDENLFVYHVHGYIPSPVEVARLSESRIVLSMDEFNELSTQFYSWQIATQIHFLNHYTCIFAGSSVSDETTQRMLHYVRLSGNKDRLYYLKADTAYKEQSYIKDWKLVNQIKMDYYQSLGLTPIVSDEGYGALYRDLVDLCSRIQVEKCRF